MSRRFRLYESELRIPAIETIHLAESERVGRNIGNGPPGRIVQKGMSNDRVLVNMYETERIAE